MNKGEILQRVSQDFIERIREKLPIEKSKQQFVLGIIGLIASGKSTVAKLLSQKFSGAVVVRNDSARFLLKERGVGWGENVRVVVLNVGRFLLENGYSVIYDGDYFEQDKREGIKKLADDFGVDFYLVRVRIDKDLALRRLEQKWERLEKGEISGEHFEDFVVVRRGQGDNLERRISLHKKLNSDEVVDIIGEIGNNEDFNELERQVDEIIKQLGSR